MYNIGDIVERKKKTAFERKLAEVVDLTRWLTIGIRFCDGSNGGVTYWADPDNLIKT